MAKTKGPLMSLEASGGFGGAIVFFNSKGRNIARQLVTPANPKTALQAAVRNALRVTAAIQKQVNACTRKGAGRLVTDQEALQERKPADQSWNGYLVKLALGTANIDYAAAGTAYAALTAGEKTAWQTAALAMVPPFSSIAQKGALDAAAPSLVAGEVFYRTEYALFKGGIATTPTGVPPVYA